MTKKLIIKSTPADKATQNLAKLALGTKRDRRNTCDRCCKDCKSLTC